MVVADVDNDASAEPAEVSENQGQAALAGRATALP